MQCVVNNQRLAGAGVCEWWRKEVCFRKATQMLHPPSHHRSKTRCARREQSARSPGPGIKIQGAIHPGAQEQPHHAPAPPPPPLALPPPPPELLPRAIQR